MRRLLTALLVLVLLLVTSAASVWTFAPQLVEMNPAPGAQSIPTRTSLRLTFSRPMRVDSAADYILIEPAVNGTFVAEGNSLVFNPDQPWPNMQEISVTLRRGARGAAFPGLPVLKSTSWSFHTGQMQLAYLWPSDGPSDLYALDVQSGEIDQLTKDAAILDFHYTPNQTSLYFSADDGQSGSRIFQLDLTGPQSSHEPQLLIECPLATCRLAQASPDGRWLAYERVPLEASGEPLRSAVWLFSLVERSSQQVGETGHDTSGPTWSFDGWLSYYDLQAGAYILLVPGSPMRTELPNQTGGTASWHPRGLALIAPEVFIETSMLGSVTTSHLIRYDLSAADRKLTGQMDISHAFDLEDNHAVFSPDGELVAFSRHYLDPTRWTPGRQIWVMRGDGSQAKALSNMPAFNHFDFAWNTDSTKIAYVRSDPTQLIQPPELWLVNADGSNPIQLVIGGQLPTWIP